MTYRLRLLFWSRRIALFLFGTLAFMAISFFDSQTFAAGSVTLAWNPITSTNVVSYKVYCGLASGVYTNAISVCVTTNATITNLTPGVAYYFVATAVDASGNESPFSNEAVYSVPANSVVSPTNQAPTLNSISNMTVISGIQDRKSTRLN